MSIGGREFALMCERYQDEGKDVTDVYRLRTHYVEVRDGGTLIEEWERSIDSTHCSTWTLVDDGDQDELCDPLHW